MSRYTYAGDFVNPTKEFSVIENPDGEGYIIGVNMYCECGAPCCNKKYVGVRAHSNKEVFEDEDTAHEWIESLEEMFEQDYDDYLEENSHAIAQMERYEQFKNEY